MYHKRVVTAELFCSLDRTPYVFVSAILFAICMFALVMISGRPRIGGLDLPKAINPLPMPDANKQDAIVLTVSNDGRTFWGQDPISDGNFPPQLRDILGRRPAALIYLRVDAHAGYRNVDKVLDALRSAGIGRVVFLVDQRKYWTSVVDYSPRFWDAARLWRSMDWLGRADFSLLALMLANTVAIILFRLHRYNTARQQSHSFVRDTASALRNGKFDEVVAIAARNSRSHLANIVGECLTAYSSAPSTFTNTEAIAAAQRAFQRNSKFVAARLKVGLGTLATIASTATFIGFLGTMEGILGAFGGTTGPPSAALARQASQIAGALLLGAIGVLVSVLAVWCFNFLRSRVAVLESEMSNAELDTISCLRTHPQWRGQFEQSRGAGTTSAVADAPAARSREVPYDRQRLVLLAMWCCALYLAYILLTRLSLYLVQL